MNSINHKNCNQCKHQVKDTGWCYMFKDKPDITPCAQHDKFAIERKITGELIRRNPILINAFIYEKTTIPLYPKKERSY